MIAGINYLRIFSVMITDWETNYTDLQANDFGNLGKNNSGNILVANHAAIFTEINSPWFFFSVGNVRVENGISDMSKGKVVNTVNAHLGRQFGWYSAWVEWSSLLGRAPHQIKIGESGEWHFWGQKMHF